MRKQLTGEPVAGELHTGFGGRGRRQPFPTPIRGSKGEFDNRSKNRPLVICYSLRESAGQTALGSTPAWSTALRFRVRWV